ncbi:MAG TPA: hypothetical protein VFN56_05330 [Candidatus Saccharimonadales bacterium]|nr:hypothetical protein [Candidatus Saccharimonadales bacterium]
MAHEAQKQWHLPLLVVGPADVLRLTRELEALDEYLHQASLRKGGDEAAKLPRTSRALDDFALTNDLNMLHADDRKQGKEFLMSVEGHSPVVTMSFAVDPSSAFIGKIITWLRQNVHPQLLLRVGLQPTIGAGCTLRTANHYFDFSLRQHFETQKQVLIDQLHASTHEGQA